MPFLLLGLLALGGLVWWETAKPAPAPGPVNPPAIPPVIPAAPTGTTMSIALAVPPGGGQGNLGVAALPLGATLILGGAAVASITSVTPTTPGLLTVAAQTATAVALQATSALSGQSTGAAVTIDWVDLATGQPQTSVLQVVAETQGTVIALQPGTMPNVILPLSNSTVTGEILFIPPPQASTDTQLPVINSGSLSPGSLSVTGSPYPAAPGTPGGSYGVVSAAAGASSLSIAWTDGSGAAQTSTIAIFVVAN